MPQGLAGVTIIIFVTATIIVRTQFLR